MLVEKGRLEMTINPDSWRQSLLNNGLQEIALSDSIAIKTAVLKGFHSDPADRLTVATTIFSTAILCTADEKFYCEKKQLKTIDC